MALCRFVSIFGSIIIKNRSHRLTNVLCSETVTNITYKYLNVCYCYNFVDFYIANRENSLWLMFVFFTKNDFKEI